jgi:hypothetical protein
MASELALWFPQHAQSMDAALALHVRRVGYDPVTGWSPCPRPLPACEIQGLTAKPMDASPLPSRAPATACR